MSRKNLTFNKNNLKIKKILYSMLNVASYTLTIQNGFQILEITTIGPHNINTAYVDIQITGATNPGYNGTFKFFAINDTTLQNRTSAPLGLLIRTETIAGTIAANIIEYTTLNETSIGNFTSLYTISNVGNYQIELFDTALYKILIYPDDQKNILKIGERLDDTDRILYVTSAQIPNGIFKAKWLMIEVSILNSPLEIRLIKQN